MSNPVIQLPLELTAFTVTDTHQQWLAQWRHLPQDTDLRVDASAVEQIDAAGLQLLASLRRTLAARGQAMALVQASDVLTRACHTLGCSELVRTVAADGAPA